MSRTNGGFGLMAVLGLGLLASMAGLAQANLIVELSDHGSVARVDLDSSAGMFSWEVGGVNQLNQQWFWYRVGNTGPELSLDTLTRQTPIITSNSLEVTYVGSGLEITIRYWLTGGADSADIAETIRIKNTTAVAQTVHFFQYSDFNLLGDPGNETAYITDVRAIQEEGTVAISETSAIRQADRYEVGYYGDTLAKLTDGDADDLDMTSSITTPGNVTWAFQWDQTIGAGKTFIISKDKQLTVPEPTTMAFLAMGGLTMIAGAIRRRKVAR